MTFYKLTSIENGDDIYVNPNLITYYSYERDKNSIFDRNVNIRFNCGDNKTVTYRDFSNMMILEEIFEYDKYNNL